MQNSTWLLRKQLVTSREAEMALDPASIYLFLLERVFAAEYLISVMISSLPILTFFKQLLKVVEAYCSKRNYIVQHYTFPCIAIMTWSLIFQYPRRFLNLDFWRHFAQLFINQDFLYQFDFVKTNQLWPIDHVWFETIKESQAPDHYMAREHENVCKTEMAWRLLHLVGLWTQKCQQSWR